MNVFQEKHIFPHYDGQHFTLSSSVAIQNIYKHFWFLLFETNYRLDL